MSEFELIDSLCQLIEKQSHLISVLLREIQEDKAIKSEIESIEAQLTELGLEPFTKGECIWPKR